MDHNTALAILLDNVKTHRKKDFRKTIEAIKYFKEAERLSYAEIGRLCGADGWTISQFDKLQSLPESVWKLIESEAIALDKGYHISRMPPQVRSELGDAISDLDAMDARAVKEYFDKNPTLSIQECKIRVLQSKTVKEKLFMVVVPLSEETYTTLKRRATKHSLSVDGMARSVIEDWLAKEAKDD